MQSAAYRQPTSYGSLKKKQGLRENFFGDSNRETTTRTTTNGFTGGKETDIDHPPTSPSNFALRSSVKSPFVKEYTYLHSEESQPEIQTRRPDPRDHGFSYMDGDRTGSPIRSPGSVRSPTTPTSPSSRPMTGYAFSYNPESPASLKEMQKSPNRASTLSPSSTKSPPSTSAIKSREPTSKTSSYPTKSSTIEKSYSKPIKPVSTTPDFGFSSGRLSRQSKDSKLDGSSSESISSGRSTS